MKDDLLSVPEAAKELGISRQAVHYAIGRLELDVVRIGNTLFVTRRSLRKYKPNPQNVRAGRARAEKSQRA
jgi:predicted DNA-binding protein YlxM (UPF0122 family)